MRQLKVLFCIVFCLCFLIWVTPSTAGEKTIYEALESVVSPEQQDGKNNMPQWVIIIDLSMKPTNSSGNAVFSLPPDTNISGNISNVSELVDIIQNVANFSSDRWISQKGDVVKIYMIHPDTIPASISIEENKRDTRFVSDLKTLVKLAGKISKAAGEEPKSVISTQRFTLTKVRSDLTVTASTASDEKQPIAKTQIAITTGPQEHWHLSADLAINKVSQLKYNSSTNSIENKEKPSKFLVGFNYAIGDILTEKWEKRGDILNGITLKLLVEASNRPLDSLAIGVGYRMPAINKYGFSLDTFTPFVAYSRVRNDKIRNDGSINEGGDSEWKWIFGVSLNLDNAMSWVSK